MCIRDSPWTYKLLLFILKKGAGGTFFDSGRLWAASNSVCGKSPLTIRRSDGCCSAKVSWTAELHKSIKQISGHSAMLWPLFVLLYFNCHLSTPTLPKPHYPSKIANTLGSLAKGELLLQCEALSTIEGSSHQHCRKHFPHWQEINIFVSVPVQLL